MRYLLIEIDDMLPLQESVENIACALADCLGDTGVIAHVIHPIPTKIMEAIEEHV